MLKFILIMMMTLRKIDLDKMRADINKILAGLNGAFWTLRTHLKEYFFSWCEYKMGKKEFLKFDDVKIEK